MLRDTVLMIGKRFDNGAICHATGLATRDALQLPLQSTGLLYPIAHIIKMSCSYHVSILAGFLGMLAQFQ